MFGNMSLDYVFSTTLLFADAPPSDLFLRHGVSKDTFTSFPFPLVYSRSGERRCGSKVHWREAKFSFPPVFQGEKKKKKKRINFPQITFIGFSRYPTSNISRGVLRLKKNKKTKKENKKRKQKEK